MELAKAILKDRKGRRGLSRQAYGNLVGLTMNRVHGLEEGRKLKEGELEKLTPFIGDLLEAPDEPEPEPELVIEHDIDRPALIERYNAVMQSYDPSNPPPIGWPSMYRIEDAPRGDLPQIAAWIDEFSKWLSDGVGDPSEPEPDSAPADSEGSEASSRAEDLPVSDPVAVQEEEDEPAVAEVVPAPAVDTVMGDKRIVTNGEMQTFKRCRRKWYLSYYRRLGLKHDDVLGMASIGTRVYKALASWYNGADPWRTFDESVKMDEERIDPEDVKTWAKFKSEVDLARAMVEGYFEWVNDERIDSGLEIVAAETTVDLDPKFPELPDVRLKAKLDVKALRTTDNARLFIDHKTVGDFVSPQKTLQLDEQMLTYCLIDYMNAMADEDPGARADGALYNMIRRVKRTETAKPPFYQRVEVRHNVDTLRSFWMRVQATIMDMERAKGLLDAKFDHRTVVYPTPSKNCAWDCDFRVPCGMMDDGSHWEEYLAEQYVEVNPLRRYEPELEGETL